MFPLGVSKEVIRAWFASPDERGAKKSIERYNKVLGKPREHMLEWVVQGDVSEDLRLYKGNLTREQFIDQYLYYMNKCEKLIPIVYMSRSYLLAHTELVPAVSSLGYMSFCINPISCFMLPSYRLNEDGTVDYNLRNAYYPAPLAVRPTEGRRLDVVHIYERDNTVRIFKNSRALIHPMEFADLITYNLSYDDHSKDDILKLFLEEYTVKTSNHRPVTTDLEGFKNMLFNDYGQKRFVLEDRGANRIKGVILWEDTGFMINMIDTVTVWGGWMRLNDGMKRRFAFMQIDLYTIIRVLFMEQFASGTLFNGGGALWSAYQSTRQLVCAPYRTYEVRSLYVNPDKQIVKGRTGDNPNTARARLYTEVRALWRILQVPDPDPKKYVKYRYNKAPGTRSAWKWQHMLDKYAPDVWKRAKDDMVGKKHTMDSKRKKNKELTAQNADWKGMIAYDPKKEKVERKKRRKKGRKK